MLLLHPEPDVLLCKDCMWLFERVLDPEVTKDRGDSDRFQRLLEEHGFDLTITCLLWLCGDGAQVFKGKHTADQSFFFSAFK